MTGPYTIKFASTCRSTLESGP